MDTRTVLAELGLSEGEIKVYLALLKLGPCPVSHIKEETGMHRTTIYDFIEKLINKALVSYVTKKNKHYYQATHPNRLMDFLNEKRDHLQQILPELNKLANYKKEDIKVEVLRGREGWKAFLNSVIRVGKDGWTIGFDESKYEKLFPIVMKQYFRQLKEKNIHEYCVVQEGAKFLYDNPTTHYRFISKQHFNPNPAMVFGDFVALHIWEPLTIILIYNKHFAESFRNFIKMLWDMAKPNKN